MTLSLLRRLVWDGIVDREEARRALHAHVTARKPFLRALLETRPDLAHRLESELGGPSGAAVVPVPELVRLLPEGLPAALLAFPVGRDERTQHVRVAAADAGDPELRAELSYHFGTAVELSAAPLRALLAAADLVAPAPQGANGAGGPGAAVHGDVLPSSFHRPSAPPIPLVRLHPDAGAPRTVKGVAPQAATGAGGAPPAPIVVTRPFVAIAEPVIELTRAKPHAQSAGTLIGMVPGDAEAPEEDGPGTLQGLADGPPSEPPPSSSGGALREGLEVIAAATTGDEVSRALAHALAACAGRVVILSVRGNVFEGREANDEPRRALVRSLVISGERPSVVATAVQTGSYLGPIPRTPVHEALAEALGGGEEQIAAGVVTVSGRAALVYVMAAMPDAARAIHRGALLSAAAGGALEGIVRKRKK